ncbi:MAG TPA: ATP-binding protein [Fibrella sp.]
MTGPHKPSDNNSLNKPLNPDVALQAAGLGAWELDPATRLINWDDRCRSLFGLSTHKRLSYEQALSYIHPDDRQLVEEAAQRVMDPASDGRYEVTVRVTGIDDGQLRWVRFMGRSYFTETGEIDSVAGLAEEVTQQVQAPQQADRTSARASTALKTSEEHSGYLIEETPIAVGLHIGPDMRIEVANDSMLSYWGKDKSVLGQPFREAVPELEGQGFLEILSDVYASGKAYQVKAARAILTVGGVLGTFYFDISFKPLRNKKGEVYAILNTAVDVTQQVVAWHKLEESEARYRALSAELEEQIRQRTEELLVSNEELMSTNEELLTTNEELEVSNEDLAETNNELIESNELLMRSNNNLQQFAYIASHDLQEPLRKIQSFGELLQHQYADALGEGVDYLQRMQVAASRMSTLIRDLLAFSRISTRQDTSGSVSLSEVVNAALSDLEMIIQETGAVVVVDPLPTIVGDASQLGQLFQNLLSNALKFRQSNVVPVIQIHAYLSTASQLPAAIKATRQANAYHRIDVTDNGIGFEEQYLTRIFQIFQRLHGKSTYAGTGIGLAICEKVVTNHGGAITASSRPGQGATFSVYLPV